MVRINRYYSWASVVAKWRQTKSSAWKQSLLSKAHWQTSQRLGLVQVAQSVKQQELNKVESLVENYRDLFEGLGKLKGFQVRLHVDEDLQPVAQPPRVPFHVRKKLEEQLLNEEQLGVTEKTEGPTPWKLRDALLNASENAYFDCTKKTEVFNDASPIGVAAVLTQKELNSDERKIIAYASRALSPTEQNYSQLER